MFQVIALCQAPFLLDDPNVGLVFPADAIARAKHYLSLTSGGLGTSSAFISKVLGVRILEIVKFLCHCYTNVHENCKYNITSAVM